MNLQGSLIMTHHWKIDLTNQDSDQNTVEAIARLVEELLVQADLERDSVIGVGCAISGYVDSLNGKVIDSWQLGWHDFELGTMLSTILHLPVLVSNNVSCISCYEHLFGRGKGRQNVLTIALGRGLGLGIVLNDELYVGSTGGAGEFGHTALAVDGRLCECGNRGCLEAYIAHRGLLMTYTELINAGGHRQKQPTLEQLLASSEDDELARLTFERAGRVFGISLANVVNLFNPDTIIVTGEGIEYGPRFFDAASQALREHTFSRLGDALQLILEPWSGYESWARGAGALVLSRYLFGK
jgi:predicted NBD/HSP70 family sugar kinase